MPYKRPNPKKSEKEHPLQTEFGVFGFVNVSNDPGWISPHLTELMDDGRFALHQFSTSIDSAKGLNMSDYKPEIASAKRAELVLKGKRALMSFLKKHIEKYRSDVEGMKNKILRQTEPPSFSDPVKSMLAELRNQEIRNIIRNTDPKHRHDLIAGNLAFIQALIDAPDDIIGKEQLIAIRREWAFRQEPELINEEKDTIEIYRAVRKRAGDINATASKMLIYSKMEDPLPPAEHFEIFTPETDHEKVLADNRIQLWDRQQAKIAKDKEFAEKNEGVNLGVDQRVGRKLRQ